jgi:hypothetical protein
MNVCIPVYDSSDVEWMLTATVQFGRAATRLDPAECDEIELLTVSRDTLSMSFDDFRDDNKLTQRDIDAIEERAFDAARESFADALGDRADYERDQERA